MAYPKPNKKGCAGYWINNSDGREFDCGYGAVIPCEDCRYSGRGGRKDPEVSANNYEKEYNKWKS